MRGLMTNNFASVKRQPTQATIHLHFRNDPFVFANCSS
jgi:hypothetical protein